MVPDAEERLWERGWDGHNQSQLLRLARLSLGDKLRWLEEAQQLALRLSQGRDARQAGTRLGPDVTSRPSRAL